MSEPENDSKELTEEEFQEMMKQDSSNEGEMLSRVEMKESAKLLWDANEAAGKTGIRKALEKLRRTRERKNSEPR